MNRGFCYYFKEGVRSSCTALFKNRHFFRYLVYFFMELIARVTLLFGALFDLAGMRQGKILRKQKQIAVSPSFREACKAGTVWTYLVAVCIEALMFLAGLVLLALLTGALGLIGYAISTLAPDLSREMFVLIFAVPGMLLALVYLVIMPIVFSPTPWIVLNNEGITVGDVLVTCFRTMKQNGKLTLALNTLVPLLVNLAILGIGVGGAFLWSELLSGSDFYTFAMILWILLASVGFAVAAPIFALTARSANEHLFEDIVLDPVAANKQTNGINITHCRGQKFEISAIESNLTALFDETDTESQPVLEEIVKEAPSVPAADLGNAIQTQPAKRGKSRRSDTEPIPEAFPTETEEPVFESIEFEPEAEEPVFEPSVFEPEAERAEEQTAETVESVNTVETEEPPAPAESFGLAEEGETVSEPEQEELPTVTEILGETEGQSETVAAETEEPEESEKEEAFEEIFADLVGEAQPEPDAEIENEPQEEISAEPAAEPETAHEKERKKTAASKLLSRLKKK